MSESTGFDDDASNDLDEAAELAAVSMMRDTPAVTEDKPGRVRDAKLTDLAEHDRPTKIGPAGDRMTDTGWGGADGRSDQVSEVNDNPEARRRLLENNRITLNADEQTAVATAFTLLPNGELDYADRPGIVCREAKLYPSLGTRRDAAREAFTLYEHEWQKQSIAEADASGGIPLMFDLKSDYRHVRDEGGEKNEKKIYLEYSQRMPKGRLDLTVAGVTPEFEAAIRAAIASPPDQQGRNLLAALQTYGQFVATNMVVGGRITLTDVRTYAEGSSTQSAVDQFRAAAEARFSLEGVPIDIGGGGSSKATWQIGEHLAKQARDLDMTVVGGEGSRASSKVSELGQSWLTTLDHFKCWQVIGFTDYAVEPVTEFLQPDLKSACVEILQKHFESQLDLRQTPLIGTPERGVEFRDPVEYRWKIQRMCFRVDRWVRAMRTEWIVDGKMLPPTDERWHGSYTSDLNGDVQIELDSDEEILSMEVRKYGLVDRLIFTTTKGNVLPSPGQKMIGGTGGDDYERHTLDGARIRGFCGTTDGGDLDSIGLRYFVLPLNTQHRSFLLAIEPYLWDFKPTPNNEKTRGG